ncbi:hypothetical protein B4096_3794 [Heyndrickxia coagulans]|nr:hypothetical protein B4096_3794 [Heyndrickxia coagulans]
MYSDASARFFSSPLCGIKLHPPNKNSSITTIPLLLKVIIYTPNKSNFPF